MVGQDSGLVVLREEAGRPGRRLEETRLEPPVDVRAHEAEARDHGVEQKAGRTGPAPLVGIELVEGAVPLLDPHPVVDPRLRPLQHLGMLVVPATGERRGPGHGQGVGAELRNGRGEVGRPAEPVLAIEAAVGPAVLVAILERQQARHLRERLVRVDVAQRGGGRDPVLVQRRHPSCDGRPSAAHSTAPGPLGPDASPPTTSLIPGETADGRSRSTRASTAAGQGGRRPDLMSYRSITGGALEEERERCKGHRKPAMETGSGGRERRRQQER